MPRPDFGRSATAGAVSALSPRVGLKAANETPPIDAFASIAVTDQGIGIAEADLESIFEPFRRSSSTRGNIPGIGLGLSVARRIIMAHGGTIEVDSRVGSGSTFRVHLPLSGPGGT